MPMWLVPVQSQVYWSGDEIKSHTPPLVQGLSATHISVSTQLHKILLKTHPSAQSVSPQANGENTVIIQNVSTMFYPPQVKLFCSLATKLVSLQVVVDIQLLSSNAAQQSLLPVPVHLIRPSLHAELQAII